MKLPEFCIKHPVFASVLSIMLVLLGIVGYKSLAISYFPEFQTPTATIHAHYTGASAQYMANEVAKQIEGAVNGVNGIKTISSSSSIGNTSITATLADNVNFFETLNKIRDKVAGVRSKLPLDMDPPIVSTGGVDRPALNVGFLSDKMTPLELRRYVGKHIYPQLIHLPGVGAVWLYGAPTQSLRVWLDPQKMASLNITASDIVNALASNNVDFPAGSIQGLDQDFSIITQTRLNNPQAFKQLILRDDNGQIVTLGDVAEVAMGGSSLTPSPVFIDGESAIDMEVRPLKSANPIDVARVTKAQLAKINKELPAGTKMVLTYDQSQFIKAAIDESFKTVAEAIFLVILVVLIFLGSVRAATIPIITIPVCTIAVFSLIALFGFTINVMTLLAIVLAIGLVVDDAIVVVENIYRYIEKGLSPLKAAFKGSREIVFAVIAMTLTLVAVYIPLSFNQGFTAIVFREFAFTLAGAVLISGFVALTLSPMMCAKLLRPTEKTSKLMLRIEAGLTRMATSYKALLTQVLARRHWVILLLLLLSIAGYGLYLILNQQLIPKEDIGYFETSITAPPGANVNYMEKNMRQLDQVFAKTPQIQHYATFVIPNGSTNFVTVQPWGKRNLTTQQLLDQLGPKVNSEISGISVTFNVPDPVNYGTTTSGFNLKLTSLTDDTDSLKTASDKVLKALQKYPGLTNLKNSLTFNEQQFSLQVNRDLAARLGVDMADISSTLSTLLGGVHVTNLDQGADSYAVRVQVAKKYLANFDVMQNLYVKTAKGDMVPLASLVTLTPTVGQAKIERYDRMDAASITGYISPSYTASDVQKEVMKVVPPLLNDNNQSYAFAGVVKQLQESQGDMLAMFILALLFIYLILAAQFESFIDPLIILLTVPLCVVGALAVLKGVGGTLNLYTNIGLLTLIGLVTKHGILIVQFANQLVRQGQEAKTAVLNAAAVRFRPILMTSSTMIFGALPLALASGPGSVGRSQIGWVLVSGLALGTLFSLFVVPAAYTYLGGKSVKLNWRWWQPEGNTNPNN